MVKKPSSVTLDDLAGMVQKGFLEQGDRMDRIEGRLGSVEGRLERVESRLTKVESRLTKVESRLTKVEEGQAILRREVNHLAFLMTELVRRDEFTALMKRVEVLEAQRS